MRIMDFPFLESVVRSHRYPLLFATVSGAHLYGFPSPDSDYDLRGAHFLPPEQVLGLGPGEETVEVSELRDGREIDLVTHDLKKYFKMILKKNGYVLEQILSPLVVQTTPEHQELKDIAQRCITRHHSHHYLGFAETQWKLFEKENPRRVKPLLYVYRVLLTGIHLMQTGKVEANLVNLNEVFRLPYIPDLIHRKIAGPEKSFLLDSDFVFYEKEYRRLTVELESIMASSTLPETPTAGNELNDLLVRLRLSYLPGLKN